MAEVTIPKKVLEDLEKKENGICLLKQELEDKHLIKVIHDNNSLKLVGQHEDIINLAVDIVNKMSGRSIPEQTKSLGGNGTVVWTFKREKAVIVSVIFKDELKHLKDENLAHVTTNLVTKVICSYKTYPQVKEKMNAIEDKLKTVLETKTTLKVALKCLAYAKKFAVRHSSVFCCVFDEESSELVFYATDKDNVKRGSSVWSKFCETGQDYTSIKFTKRSSELTESQQIGDNADNAQTCTVMDADWNDQCPDEGTQTNPSTGKSDDKLKTKRGTAEGKLKTTISIADNQLKRTTIGKLL